LITRYIILFLFLTTVKSSDDINITSSAKPYDESKIQSYLEQFGYLESNGSLLTETSLTSASHTNEALIRFQEFYNLPTDGTLNQETLLLSVNQDVALKIIQQLIEFIIKNGIK
jgi:hypothetical protein